MEINTVYILLSEKESLIENDFKMLLDLEIFTEEEILKDDTILVCISRDYFDLPYTVPALRIRDQLSNVFCPDYRVNSVKYEPFRNFSRKTIDIPDIKVIVKNEEVYENLDYYMHLKRFDKIEKMNLNDESPIFEPVDSKIGDYAYLGKLSVDIMNKAGYDKNINGIVPGWVFQSSNPWLTRLMDLRGISSILQKEKYTPYIYTTKQDLIKALENPTILDGPYIGEDARSIFCKSFESRQIILDESIMMLESLG